MYPETWTQIGHRRLARRAKTRKKRIAWRAMPSTPDHRIAVCQGFQQEDVAFHHRIILFKGSWKVGARPSDTGIRSRSRTSPPPFIVTRPRRDTGDIPDHESRRKSGNWPRWRPTSP